VQKETVSLARCFPKKAPNIDVQAWRLRRLLKQKIPEYEERYFVTLNLYCMVIKGTSESGGMSKSIMSFFGTPHRCLPTFIPTL